MKIKQLALIYVLILLLASASIAGWWETDPNLVGWWKMDEVSGTLIADSSGNGNNGTSQRDCSLLHTTGKVGGALSFNGTSDYIDTGNTFNSTFRDSFSINMWCKVTDGIGNSQVLFGVANYGGSHILIISIETTGKFTATFQAGTGAVKLFKQEDAASFIDGQNDWKMATVVATKEDETSGHLAIYIDGVLKADGLCDQIVFADYTPTSFPYIGAEHRTGYSNSRFLTGSLDDVMIFSRVLTQAEITQLYQQGNPLSCFWCK